jgi:hypothetical protein
MNDIKYTGETPKVSLSEIEIQVDSLSKDIETLYLISTELEERLKSVLSPSYPEEESSKGIMCSISPLGMKLETIHGLVLYRISHLRDLNNRIKL